MYFISIIVPNVTLERHFFRVPALGVDNGPPPQ